jgi:hypothetical protein
MAFKVFQKNSAGQISEPSTIELFGYVKVSFAKTNGKTIEDLKTKKCD